MRRIPGRIILAGTFAALILCSLASRSRSKIDQIDDAAQAGDLEKVKMLLKDDPDLVFSKKAPDPDRNYGAWTPLHYAAANGQIDVVKLLLANKADINARTDWGETPFLLTAEKGHTELAELLIASNADINAKAGHETSGGRCGGRR